MKQNKGLLFIVIILICFSFIFGRVEIKYIYYHQKLNEHQKLEQEIYSLLDQSFLDCCIYNWNDDNIYRETLINGKNGYKTGIEN